MANGGGTDSSVSPTSSGAMDSLLEKLRAAAPQAKDQRDRRRRARLKERHQVRVASGQRMPSLLGAEADDGEGVSMISAADATDHLAPQEDAKSNGAESVSEGEDIADRAANLLQGLRSNNTDTDEERNRRRRESAEDERRARRLRMRSRNAATNGSKDSADGLVLPSLRETSAAPEDDIQSPTAAASQPTPAIVVSSESGDQTTTDNNNDNSNHQQQSGLGGGGEEEEDVVMDGSSRDRPVEISD
jgi:cytokinesis protein